MAKEKTQKELADEIIQKRLQEIAGEGDIITVDGKDTPGHGEGKEVEIEEDEESKKIVEGFGLKSFGSLSEVEPESNDDIVDAVDVEGDDEPEQIPESKETPVVDVEGNEVKEDKNKVAYADRDKKESEIKDMKEDIEAEMEKLGMSKDVVMDLIFQLTDDGYIEEQILLFGGRLKAVVRSPKMVDSAEFIDMMDEEQMNTPAKVEFYINMYSVAAVLVKYGKEDLSEMSIKERVEWIEKNIPTVLYKVLLPDVMKFHQKIEILSSEKVADFFS